MEENFAVVFSKANFLENRHRRKNLDLEKNKKKTLISVFWTKMERKKQTPTDLARGGRFIISEK